MQAAEKKRGVSWQKVAEIGQQIAERGGGSRLQREGAVGDDGPGKVVEVAESRADIGGGGCCRQVMRGEGEEEEEVEMEAVLPPGSSG
ncbi:hypothetical protein AMTR_s00097p00130580 [Amborella trichopoda]|uniref:Uncharacterized protein n=1 Tax=Amborella trichopoda TaxID=13333 RepID=W1P2F9_AMBTC|nr:hypothetical protein AMTR_s00097p00130580 [Amborella trichopoda]